MRVMRNRGGDNALGNLLESRIILTSRIVRVMLESKM